LPFSSHSSLGSLGKKYPKLRTKPSKRSAPCFEPKVIKKIIAKYASID